MPYPIKVKKHKISKGEYFRERETKEFLKRKPKYYEYIKEGERQTQRYPERIHKKGELVIYKNRLGVVKNVSSKGVHIQELRRDKSGLLSPRKKLVFISEKEYSRNAKPFYSQSYVLSSVFPFRVGEYR